MWKFETDENNILTKINYDYDVEDEEDYDKIVVSQNIIVKNITAFEKYFEEESDIFNGVQLIILHEADSELMRFLPAFINMKFGMLTLNYHGRTYTLNLPEIPVLTIPDSCYDYEWSFSLSNSEFTKENILDLFKKVKSRIWGYANSDCISYFDYCEDGCEAAQMIVQNMPIDSFRSENSHNKLSWKILDGEFNEDGELDWEDAELYFIDADYGEEEISPWEYCVSDSFAEFHLYLEVAIENEAIREFQLQTLAMLIPDETDTEEIERIILKLLMINYEYTFENDKILLQSLYTDTQKRYIFTNEIIDKILLLSEKCDMQRIKTFLETFETKNE